jgi:hypothetical protein
LSSGKPPSQTRVSHLFVFNITMSVSYSRASYFLWASRRNITTIVDEQNGLVLL